MKTPGARERISLAEMARQSGAVLRRGDSGHFSWSGSEAAPTLADLTESLFFSPGDGRIWLNDQRMVLIHSSAMGHMRRELIDTLGQASARGLLTRAGYVSGARDAQLVRERWPDGDAAAVFMAGARLHALEGMVKVTPVTFSFDMDRGVYDGEFIWEHSTEDDEHIGAYGIGSEVACWQQIGYATGYVTTLFGQQVIFREIECRATGAPVCRVVGRHAAAWGDISEDLRYLEAQDFRSLVRPIAEIQHPQPARTTVAAAQVQTQDATLANAERHAVVGASPAFVSACHMLDRVARTQATVLFTGESGVGKEAFARRLHLVSPRAQQPFIAVNCAAIPETLWESELFGVDKGAFTGATAARPGRFERADGGTLFLDEIGTLSMVAQAKLLRVLQEGEIERVGGTRLLRVDVRLVAATNVNLQAEVQAGRFRADLFYRLNVFPIHLPPLRERREDIPLLMNHFLHREARRHGRRVAGFSAQAVRALLHYDWPGNIRELLNLIERGVISAEDGCAIDVHHMFRGEARGALPVLALSAKGDLVTPRGDGAAGVDNLLGHLCATLDAPVLDLARLEARLLNEAVQASGGNLSAAARMLGLSRAQIAYRLERTD
ncbi:MULTISPECIES: sigma 54-interacting transcriptional regulator [unclassified Acidovorax]|uniref:sigma 54-interacting transcriptional regulator n=1 Tax=unclassified Acidovorax TaxID=2684926 RepID=UPI0028831D04|nr:MULTISPECIES: sigma 54-interacting transcriptional regulator [unclassified Acidovorax]